MYAPKMSLVLGLFALTHVAAAQTPPSAPLTLDAAISEARNANPDLKRLAAAAERQSWGKLEALSGHMPKLSLGYDHYLASKFVRQNVLLNGTAINFPGAYPADTASIDVTWNLIDGGTTLYSYRAADLNSRAAELELSRAKFQVEESVTVKYYAALAAQKLLDVANQNIKTLEDHLNRAKLTEKAGYGTQFDILRIQATLEEARSEQEAALNNVAISREALLEVMGREGVDEMPLVGELPVLSESTVPKNLSLEVTEREDFRAQTLRDEASSKLATAAHGFWFPSVSLFAQEDYYRFGGFDRAILEDSTYHNASSVGIRLKWNLFDGGYSYAKQREAVAASIEAQAQTRKELVKLPKEFDTWKRKFFYNVSLYKARLRAQEQFQESVRLAEVGLKAGARTHTEALDAELDLFRARGGVVRAQAEAIEALAQLELAVGHHLGPATLSK